jgi:hypothetical protein
LFVLIAVIPITAGAVGLGLRLGESIPVKYFTETDWAKAKAVVKQALEEGEIGETFRWQNESTGHNGIYRVLKHLEIDGRNCRDLLIKHVAGGARAIGDYRFCLMESGEWKTTGRVPVE